MEVGAVEALVEDDTNLITGTVHRDVAVAVKSRKYRQLADYLKAPINLAWARLKRGRMIRVVRYGETVLFLLTLDPAAREVGSILDEQDLDEALSATDAGRVITDPYELRLVVRLIDKFGEPVK
jgi:hypothetical protein